MITLLCIGKNKEKSMQSIQDEYLKRISKFTKIKLVELKEGNPKFEEVKLIDDETNRLLQAIPESAFVILLDVTNKQMDSIEFSELIESTNYHQETFIVIGGSMGYTDALRARANKVLSMSKMTFPHLLARIMVLEQVFRAYKILNNQTYHK